MIRRSRAVKPALRGRPPAQFVRGTAFGGPRAADGTVQAPVPRVARHWAFTCPASDKSAEGNEDRVLGDDASMRYAAADGVTAGVDSGVWAGLLVHEAVAVALPTLEAERDEWLGRPLELWQANRALGSGRSTPAWSTLLTMALTPSTGGLTCTVIGVGDTCFFLIRDSTVVVSFPMEWPDQFDDAPDCFSTLPLLERSADERARTIPRSIILEVRAGDRLLLATDAMAKFLLEHAAAGSAASIIDDLTQSADPAGLIAAWRESRPIRLHDDDVGVLMVDVGEAVGSGDEDVAREGERRGVNLPSLTTGSILAGTASSETPSYPGAPTEQHVESGPEAIHWAVAAARVRGALVTPVTLVRRYGHCVARLLSSLVSGWSWHREDRVLVIQRRLMELEQQVAELRERQERFERAVIGSSERSPDARRR